MEFINYKFIKIQPLSENPDCKRVVHEITSRTGGDLLGRIIWYPPWRTFILESRRESAWSADCLADVQDYMEKLKQIA